MVTLPRPGVPRIVSNWPSFNAWMVKLPDHRQWRFARTWPEALAIVQRWYAERGPR